MAMTFGERRIAEMLRAAVANDRLSPTSILRIVRLIETGKHILPEVSRPRPSRVTVDMSKTLLPKCPLSVVE